MHKGRTTQNYFQQHRSLKNNMIPVHLCLQRSVCVYMYVYDRERMRERPWVQREELMLQHWLWVRLFLSLSSALTSLFPLPLSRSPFSQHLSSCLHLCRAHFRWQEGGRKRERGKWGGGGGCGTGGGRGAAMGEGNKRLHHDCTIQKQLNGDIPA